MTPRPKFPTPYQERTLWNAITGISLLVLGALVAGFVWLFTEVISYLQAVLIPLAVAGVIAYLLEPVVKLLVRKGLSRFRAVLLVFLALAAIVVGLAAYILPKTFQQVGDLVANRERIVGFVKKHADNFLQHHTGGFAQEWLTPGRDPAGNLLPSKAETWLKEHTEQILSHSWTLAGRGLRGVTSFLGLALGVFLVPIYLWFFLIESQAIQGRWERFIPLRASRFKREIVATLTEINDYLIAFFRGQLLVSLIDGALVGVALALFRLPYAPIIGLGVAVLGLIPYIGNLVCWIPAVIISILHFSVPENQHWLGPTLWYYPVAVSLIFFGVQQINSFVTAPKIVGDSVGLHPMTVIFSVFFWSLLLGGALGALLAVPLSASVKVLFRRYIWARKLNEPLPAVAADGEGPVGEAG